MKKYLIPALVFIFLAAGFFKTQEAQAEAQELPVIEAALGTAPNVPPPVDRDTEARVIVRLEAQEYRGEL